MAKTSSSKTSRKRAAQKAPAEGRHRVVIEAPTPVVDGGRYPAKRIIGDRVEVEADIFADGHDAIRAQILYRRGGQHSWRRAEMHPLINDRWRGEFVVDTLGTHEFIISAWIDRFGTWRTALLKKHEANQDVESHLHAGLELIDEAIDAVPADAAARMRAIRGLIDPERPPLDQAVAVATGEELRLLMDAHLPQLHVVTLDPPLQIWADREKAGFSAWYEMFPRSASPDPNRHGTLGDLTKRLPYVASMGFDVLYLPPIHPIGRTKRKGRNNAITCDPGDVGSPWAIGAAEGGHKSIHPDLGDERDFAALIKEAERLDIEIALDVALQCSPDHPYVREHPEWFRHRPDGSIQYAENPPKKYEDIYPIDFECQQWEALWAELRSIFDHWIERGVRIFRVDNPHTKSFTFWEWLAAGLRRDHPDVLLLAEAFTRPKVMHRLAKIGFHQSYTYFTWRNDAWSLQQYMHELTQQPPREFFRPNFWSNTPDILSEYVQHGGRSGSVIRLILAATLSANYGIYGPPFELVRTEPRPGKEEYIDNEKYEVHHWDLTEEHSLSDLIALVNRIRRANPALQQTNNITFHNCDNPAVLCFSKQSDDGVNTILCAVNTDPHHTQWANLDLNMPALGLDWHDSFQAHDLLSGARYAWQGQWNTVALHPHSSPAHILRVRRHGRTEHDFEYFV